ncbi:MAG: LysE family translocator [Pseudomonadota bacterium]
MSADLLFAFALVFTLDSLSPGPAVAAVMARAASGGLGRAVPFVAGLVAGDLVLFALAVAGLAALAAALGPFFLVVKWLGVAYLLYLAWQLWRAPVVTVEAAAPAGEGWRLFGLGALLPLGNPKAIGFYVAILPSVLDAAALGWAEVSAIATIIVAVWSLVLLGYAAAAARARRMMRRPSALRLLNRLSAGAMAGAAATIAARA